MKKFRKAIAVTSSTPKGEEMFNAKRVLHLKEKRSSM